jgi:predicted nucleic acid-binding protein
MTLAELNRWALQHNWGKARREWLDMYLEKFVILPYTNKLCMTWAEVTVAARATGRRIECADAWIAATAIHIGVPLVTHNYSNYLGVPNLRLISHGS